MGRMAQIAAARLVRALVRLGWTLDRQTPPRHPCISVAYRSYNPAGSGCSSFQVIPIGRSPS